MPCTTITIRYPFETASGQFRAVAMRGGVCIDTAEADRFCDAAEVLFETHHEALFDDEARGQVGFEESADFYQLTRA